MKFERKTLLAQQTVGELFSRTREAHGWSKDVAARKVNIQIKYIDALEHGRYEVMEAVTYAQQYAERYARILGLPWSTVEPLFTAETQVYHPLHTVNLGPSIEKKRVFFAESFNTSKAVHILPRLLTWGAVGILIAVFFAYVAFEVSKVFTPPDLVIIAPEHDMIVVDRELTVSGKTAPEAIVTINGDRVNITNTGEFTETVYLHEGLNTIRISTRSERSSERAEVRHILYTPQ